jgi:hypothetical protein
MRTLHYHDSDFHKRTKIVIILLSLLLNVALLIMLGLIEPLKDIESSFYLIPAREDSQNISPQNQSPVYFQNLPSSSTTTPQPVPITPQAAPQPQKKQWVSLNGGQLHEKDHSVDEPSQQPLALTQTTQNLQDDTQDESEDNTADTVDALDESIQSDNMNPPSKPIVDTSTCERQQTMLSDLSSSQPRTAQSLARTRKKRPSKPSSSPLTMSQLVQGFMDPKTHARPSQKTHGFGNSAVMEGKGYGVPTKEQLVYERYIQRIVRCLQSAYEAHKYSLPSVRMRVEPINVAFSLDLQGKLINIVIAQSSNNTLIDQFVLTVFNDASTSFPPVPACIYESPFNLQCIDALMLMSVRNAQLIIK